MVADEIEAIDAAVAAVKVGDKTDVHLKVKPHPKFKEIYQVMLEDGAQRLATKNLTPGLNVYGERLFKFKYLSTVFGMLSAASLQAPLSRACRMCQLNQALKCFIWELLQEQRQAMSQTSLAKTDMFTASSLHSAHYAT